MWCTDDVLGGLGPARQATDTPDAYREFLARYPDDPLAKLAELKLAEME